LPAAQRRFDPDRRARIVRATLDVVAEHGVAGTTHRRVAAAADVPLGSMTYHFDSLDALLTEAFTGLADTVSARFADRLAAAATGDEAREGGGHVEGRVADGDGGERQRESGEPEDGDDGSPGARHTMATGGRWTERGDRRVHG